MYSTTKPRPRDSQATKIAEACFAMKLWMNDKSTTREIEEFMTNILKSRWWTMRRTGITLRSVTFVPSNSVLSCNPVERTYGGYGSIGATFQIKVWPNMTKVDAMHMLAHFIPAPETPWHGREFARALLDLFIKYTDKDTVKQLRKEFRERKIRTYAWTEEAKQGASERYVAKQYPKAEEGLLNIMRELEAKGVTPE